MQYLLHDASYKALFGKRDHAFVTKNLVGGRRRHIKKEPESSDKTGMPDVSTRAIIRKIPYRLPIELSLRDVTLAGSSTDCEAGEIRGADDSECAPAQRAAIQADMKGWKADPVELAGLLKGRQNGPVLRGGPCVWQSKPREERGPVTLTGSGSILFGYLYAVFFDAVDHGRARHAQKFRGLCFVSVAHFQGLDDQVFVEFIETHARLGNVNL